VTQTARAMRLPSPRSESGPKAGQHRWVAGARFSGLENRPSLAFSFEVPGWQSRVVRAQQHPNVRSCRPLVDYWQTQRIAHLEQLRDRISEIASGSVNNLRSFSMLRPWRRSRTTKTARSTLRVLTNPSRTYGS